MIGATEWCGDCHTHREVVDDHLEETMSAMSNSYTTKFTEVRVIDLSCGHSKAWDTGHVHSSRDADA